MGCVDSVQSNLDYLDAWGLGVNGPDNRETG